MTGSRDPNATYRFTRRLPDKLKKRLHGHIQIFLNDKQFYGFQGLGHHR